MSEAKKITVGDLMSKMENIEKEMAVIRERNEYMVLRCECLLKALLNADELPDLTAKPSAAKVGADGSASDPFAAEEVPI